MTTRRTILTAAAWTAPVVLLATTTAPAYATSAACTPVGFKHPGQSDAGKSWAYVVRPGCAATVGAVVIDGKPATQHPSGVWVASFTDSRAHRTVQILDQHAAVLYSGAVVFPPTKEGAS